LTGISSVDVGNYTCEVGGPQNTVLASVTHQLYVRGTSKAGARIHVTSHKKLSYRREAARASYR